MAKITTHGPVKLCMGCGRFMPIDEHRRLLPHTRFFSDKPCIDETTSAAAAKEPELAYSGVSKPEGKWKCRVCGHIWDGESLVLDPTSTATKWICADYFCGGTCDSVPTAITVPAAEF
jgi:hypothetical protein